MNTRIAGTFGRYGWRAAVVTLAVLIGSGSAAGEPGLAGRLLARDQMTRLGLVRAWFSQVQLDVGHSRVEKAILSGNQLFVLTDAGTLHAFNASTGETQWVATFGNPKYPSLGPAANESRVAILNGSTLYVLDRDNGRTKITRRVGGAPGAAPAMSSSYCFVPMVTGRVEGYPVANEKMPLWFYESQGRAMVAPLTTAQSVVWSTAAGHIYFGNALAPGVKFRLETPSEIVAPPAAHGSMIYIGTVEGELIAADELNSSQPWRFAAGDAILRSPAAVGGRIYVTTTRPALFAVDALTGQAQWSAPKVTQFAAASHERIYAMDDLGALVVLNASNGVTLERMPTDGTAMALVNDQTDRLYLVSNTGLVQCLHEIGADQPIFHQPLPEAKPTDADATTQPSAAATGPAKTTQPSVPAQDDNPFGPPAGGAPAGKAPAGNVPAGGTPAGKADDNPFGGFGGGASTTPFGGAGAGGAGNKPAGTGGAGAGGAAGGDDDNPFGK